MHAKKRSPSRLARWCAGLVAHAATLALQNDAPAQAPKRRPLLLFSPEEAAQLRMGDGDWPRRPRLRSVAAGPRIVFQRPEVQDTGEEPTVRLTSPAALVVRFEANRAPVAMDTLKVIARKSWFSKSLTGLLLPYVRGTTLQVDELEIPQGNFLVEVGIADTQGTETTASYRFAVSGR